MLTLRQHMNGLEGEQHTTWAIGYGFSAWRVERDSFVLHRKMRITVFAKSRSDALRKASAPARLGEECYGDVSEAQKITSGWDEPIAWPTQQVQEGASKMQVSRQRAAWVS